VVHVLHKVLAINCGLRLRAPRALLVPRKDAPMPVQQPNKVRRALLAGAVVLALSGAGAAVVWAAGAPEAPSHATATQPTPSETAAAQAITGKQATASAPASKDAVTAKEKDRARELHGESVVRKSDGSLESRVTQFGTVDAASDSSITVKSEDGFGQKFAINADTRIFRLPKAAADGTAPRDGAGKLIKPSAATASDLKTGDAVLIKGIRNGADLTAKTVVSGPSGAKGSGHGTGKTKGGNGQGKPRGSKG
jgi:hypothetical protein